MSNVVQNHVFVRNEDANVTIMVTIRVVEMVVAARKKAE